MARVFVAIGAGAVIGLIISLIVFSDRFLPKGRVYDCSLAEFHPDYPVEVKNECRRIRSQKLTTT